jgi:predicted ArsR family transcriptional regulator
MVVLLKRFQGWDSASRRVPEAPADLFCQYPLVLEMNMRIERGVPGLNRLVRALGEPTRRAVYLAVENARRPMTRLEVADTLHISRRLAAFHLDKLTEEGLLDVHYARPAGRPGGPGAGRSAKWYRASSVEFDLTIPPRRSDIAARVLALTMEQLGPDGPHHEALLDQARACGTALSQAQAADSSVTDQLGRLGYQPEHRGDGVIELRNCPFHQIVTVARDTACTLNQALLAAYLDERHDTRQAVLEPAEHRCCVLLRPSSDDT